MTDKNGFSGPEAIRDFLNPGKLPPTPLVELPPSLNPLDEEFQPLLHGMIPKGAYRPGTPNVAAIVGMGKAAEIAFEWNTPPIGRHWRPSGRASGKAWLALWATKWSGTAIRPQPSEPELPEHFHPGGRGRFASCAHAGYGGVVGPQDRSRDSCDRRIGTRGKGRYPPKSRKAHDSRRTGICSPPVSRRGRLVRKRAYNDCPLNSQYVKSAIAEIAYIDRREPLELTN